MEFLGEAGIKERCKDDGLTHPPGEVSFEAELIGIAGINVFAGDFDHDRVLFGWEENVRAIGEALNSSFPGLVGFRLRKLC